MSRSQFLAASMIAGVTPGSSITSIALSGASAQQLSNALHKDASDFHYSGLVSLGEAIAGIQKQRYSWATVKAYYASFYLARAALAANGMAIFYVGSKPLSWVASAGSSPVKRKGNTHDLVLQIFDQSTFMPTLMNQVIGLTNAVDWLNDQRTLANYKLTRFPDPSPTQCMTFIASSSLRAVTDAYIADQIGMYYLDQDHAILAFPLELVKSLNKINRPALEPDERKHLMDLYRDAKGPFPAALRLFS
jgi:hypothetical protein